MGHYDEQYAEFGALCDELNKAVENKDPKKFAEAEKKISELPNTGKAMFLPKFTMED